MQNLIDQSLEFVYLIGIYLKLVVIIALIIHSFFKRKDVLSQKHRSKIVIILIFTYLFIDFSVILSRKFFITPLILKEISEQKRKSAENYNQLNLKIDKVSDKMYDDFGIDKKIIRDTIKK